MLVLVINCGSSSLKYQLFDMSGERVLAKGLVERIGMSGSVLIHQPAGGEKTSTEQPVSDHQKAVELVLMALNAKETGVIDTMQAIQAVGHRVVHGGEAFTQGVLIDSSVLAGIKECVDLAPLHNPPNITGIEACGQLLPGVPQVAVFDTAFHQTIPPEGFLYGLPYELYEKYKIRRYGFHGTSHQYVAGRAAAMLGRPLQELRLITCHLGNGASVTAVQQGRSRATSMGFTPLEGLVMGTRSGDLDPAIATFLMEKESLTTDQVNDLLNKKSGVQGISGLSSDFRDLEEAAAQGHSRAQLALEVFVTRVKEYIGAYAALLNGVDAVVFTAGLGENSSSIRQQICQDMNYLGLTVNPEKNNIRGIEADISAPSARVRALVIPTNEELVIARETGGIVGSL
ncbi:MAG: acetate/propionate family kinase [Thermincolia bacterium]